MNSSIENLKDIRWNFVRMINDEMSALNIAKIQANYISDIFLNYNNQLANSWKVVAETCEKVNASIFESLRSFNQDLGRFIEQAELNEEPLNNTVNAVNEKSNEILNSLGIK